MLNPKLIPTPLLAPEERPRIDIVDTPPRVRLRAVFVLTRLAGLAWRLAALKWSGRLSGRRMGATVGRFCRKMGVLWIKVAQLLSMRSDAFPRDFCDELAKLQDRADGFPPERAIAALERELGAPVHEIFSFFEKEPFAAASIAQVHKAKLRKEGDWTAVKIRRPEVEVVFARDLALIRFLIRVMIRLSIYPQMRWRDMLWEIESALTEELDYRYEMSRQKRLRRTLRGHGIFAPRVFSAYSTAKVLTMEFVEGVYMSDYLSVMRRDPARLAQWLAENDIDPERVGRSLLFSYLRQMLEDRLFHADLHPGNLVLLRDSRLAFIDFGSAGTVEGDFLRKYDAYLRALATGEYAKAVDIFLLIAPRVPKANVASAKEDLIRRLQFWGSRCRVDALPYDQKSASSIGDEMSKTLTKYGMDVIWSFLLILRGWATMDASLRALIPHANLPDLVQRYVRQRRRRARKRLLRHAPADLFAVERLIDYPKKRYEENLYRGEVVRRVAQAFEGAASKASRLAASAFGLGSAACLAVAGYGAAAAARQYYGASLGWTDGNAVNLWLTNLPSPDWQVWALSFLFVGRAFQLLAGLRARFLEKEAHFAS